MLLAGTVRTYEPLVSTAEEYTLDQSVVVGLEVVSGRQLKSAAGQVRATADPV